DVLHRGSGGNHLYPADKVAGLEDGFQRAADGIVGTGRAAGTEDQIHGRAVAGLGLFGSRAIGAASTLWRVLGLFAAAREQGAGQPQRGGKNQSTRCHGSSPVFIAMMNTWTRTSLRAVPL